jgi:hypothetical protein
MRERSTPRSQRAQRARRRAWGVALVLSALLGGAAPAPARAESPLARGADITFDLIIVRPLNVGLLAFGAICFVPSALFAVKSLGEPWETFVQDPFEATFTRPLGEFEEEY